MRAVVQRVTHSEVMVDGEICGAIGPGFNVLVGIGREDTEQDLAWMVEKIINLRVFDDENGDMNRSILETGGALLLISQFTIQGDCRKGRRPSFFYAMPQEEAKRMYERFVELCKDTGIEVACGVFQAHMQVNIANDGPVTLLIDSKKTF